MRQETEDRQSVYNVTTMLVRVSIVVVGMQ
jgi:hypothetical protein